MGSEEIRHSISLRPHPFHLDPNPSRQSSPRPESLHRHVGPPTPADAPTPTHFPYSHEPYKATTTAYEASTPNEENDPVARLHSSAHEGDVERQSPAQYTEENDPFQLAARLKTASEIDLIKANSSRKRTTTSTSRSTCTPNPLANSTDISSWRRGRAVEEFYESQNANIERLLKPVDEHRAAAKAEQGSSHLKYQIAVQGSFVANVLLAGLQMYGAVSSGLLSIFTTMVDSLFDPLSNVMLILCNRAVGRVDSRKFPSGKARIETAGNIIFCFVMIAVSLVVIVMSCRDLIGGSETDTKDFHLPSVLAVAIAFFTKLALFFYCYALRNIYSQVRILWEDHRNDLLINGFGLMTAVLGSKLKWWIDAMGAIVLSTLIIFLWARTAYSEFQLLIGVSADTHTLQLITYISMTHSEHISAIDTVRAYHSGPRLIVEVDIVMDADDSLRSTHDVAEELQTKLESLPDVERAYVHVDYETSHAPEHFLKKEL
ncbi:cation diffusion facilitator 1 [Eremomyces bilateralis CBS 781.70]|uniref:Cation diffusion facilitator 1 n=1 Tax=Eremomyces bilateralis CBS 781.70 TaxID=1392243 RepID=A0A6G1FV69_9PEZI|nr:cation diffusion facilitator 1 [Eremomyces bilateralis CBS 781.70]KAF1809551.1 cation diffusion facilitator 1 [Eremomyces bilateralis CBS 781.70]